MNKRKDLLAEALAQLKQAGRGQEPPQEVVHETLRRIADCGPGSESGVTTLRIADSGTHVSSIRNPQSEIRNFYRLVAAAAVFVVAGYLVGRLSAPKPMDLQELHAALAPSLAAALELALREKLAAEMRQHYQLGLASTYVRVKDELTEQYRSDLNRFAVQTLVASNAVTNDLLTQLLDSLDTAKAQDFRRIALALSEIERNRVQDKTQLASGLQTLAYRTEDELSRTKQELVRLLVDVRPEDSPPPLIEPKQTYPERSKP